MPLIDIPYLSLDLQADGNANGIVTVTDTSALFVGSTVNLISDTVDGKALVIDAILDSTTVAVKDPLNEGYTRFDCSAYLTGDNAALVVPPQQLNTTLPWPTVLNGAANEVAVFSSPVQISGTTGLTWDGTTFEVDGLISSATQSANTSSVTTATIVDATVTNSLTLAGGLIKHTVSVGTSSHVTSATDEVIFMSDDAARTASIPGAAPAGTEYTFVDTSGSVTVGHTITITPTSGTINGAATAVITPGTNKSVTVISDGTNYFITAKF